jgi:hypothetical protein
MKLFARYCRAGTVAAAALLVSMPAAAWDLAGTKTVTLHSRDGQAVVIGQVDFVPRGERIGVAVRIDHDRFKDYFLSMKEFKCLEGASELQCYVPYPYPNPATVTAGDFAWLEHALMFFYKAPKDFGAKLWNGIYYRLERTEQGLVGTPQAIDLNQIGAPPADTTIPPYGAAERSNVAPDARWFNRLTIE